MPRDMTVLNMFIASPGGVADERDAAESVAGRLNASLGRIHNMVVNVQRFEQLVGDAGNPQRQINLHADDSDIFVGIIYRRWGSDTGNGFDSGFHEEFTRALRRWESSGAPRIALFFKTVDPESLADPGEQLSKVLEFKRLIETDHTAFYNSFSTAAELEGLVTSVVAEELARASQGTRTAAGEGATATKALVAQSPEGHEPLSLELEAVVGAFADALGGRDVGAPLDIDRFELLALAISRDSDRLPTHLANRLYTRREELALIPGERRLWFHAYLRDVGRSSGHEDRVIPFAAVVGRDWIQDALRSSARELLREEESSIGVGAIRLMRRLSLRPRNIWPVGSGTNTATELERIWEAPADASKADVIRYWLSVSRKHDRRRARLLASSPGSIGDVGRVLEGLLGDQPSGGALAEVDPTLLLDPLVRARFEDAAPERTLSDEVLTKLVDRKYVADEVRRMALEELARRDRVPESVVSAILNTAAFTRWDRIVQEALLNRVVGPRFIQSLLTALQESSSAGDENETRRRTGDAVAMLARRNIVVQNALAAVIDPVQHFNENVLRWRLIRASGDPRHRATATAVLNRTDPGYRAFAALLDSAGWESRTMKFVEDRIDLAMIQYLLSLPESDREPLASRRVREMARDRGSLFRHDAMRLLVPVANDQDIEMLLENVYVFDDPDMALVQMLGRASLKRLRILTTSDDERVACLALRELAVRERALTNGQLIKLLRSPLATVRMLALEQLAARCDLDRLAVLAGEYVKGKGTHYYNVLCEIDDRLAGIAVSSPSIDLVA